MYFKKCILHFNIYSFNIYVSKIDPYKIIKQGRFKITNKNE